MSTWVIEGKIVANQTNGTNMLKCLTKTIDRGKTIAVQGYQLISFKVIKS